MWARLGGFADGHEEWNGTRLSRDAKNAHGRKRSNLQDPDHRAATAGHQQQERQIAPGRSNAAKA